MPREDPPLRSELVEARGKIVAQLDEMRLRMTFPSYGRPPPYQSLISELEGQLREIDTILGINEEPET